MGNEADVLHISMDFKLGMVRNDLEIKWTKSLWQYIGNVLPTTSVISWISDVEVEDVHWSTGTAMLEYYDSLTGISALKYMELMIHSNTSVRGISVFKVSRIYCIR